MTKPYKLKIEDMYKIASQRGGKCLSQEYLGVLTKLRWQCNKGHVWDANPHDIQRGTWCPICAGTIKLTIEEMHRIAKERSGKCLSKKYVNAQTKLKWQCKEGHIWEATPNSIKVGSWCPYCAGYYQTIKDMQQLAKDQRGKCLSKKYNNAITKLKWQCAERHVFLMSPSSVKSGTWCPVCGRKKLANSLRLTIEDMQEIAEKRKGKCLSNTYVDANTKLLWQCRNGHTWEATPGHVKNGTWCPICGGTVKLTIEEMQNIANKHGGKCLSKKYIDANTKLQWQCSEGHIWEAIPNSIRLGTWCPYCVGRHQTIKDMQQLAEDRGGKCLSKEYATTSKKLKWQCSEGHVWDATPNGIKSGHWCPICSSRLNEKICRRYFELIFNKHFPKKRHPWLNNLELDGYCKDLQLAFEYQGLQHYKKIFPHQNLKKQRQRDRSKKLLCKKHNVTLIIIPYNIKPPNIQKYIIQQCKIKKVNLPKKISLIDPDFLNIYTPGYLDELREIAKERSGKCLSNSYLGSDMKLKWQCSEGHIFQMRPANVKIGNWCPKCTEK